MKKEDFNTFSSRITREFYLFPLGMKALTISINCNISLEETTETLIRMSHNRQAVCNQNGIWQLPKRRFLTP